MHKIWIISKREYLAMVRTKTFIVTIVLMPLLMLGGILAQEFLEGRIDISDKHVVVIDPTGRLMPGMQATAERRNLYEVFDKKSGHQVSSKFVLESGSNKPLTDEEHLALSERVRKGELFAFLEIYPDILEQRELGRLETKAVVYSESLGAGSLRRWVFLSVNAALQSVRLAEAGIDAMVVMQAMAPVDVENLGLSTRTSDGKIKRANKASRKVAQLVPFAILMLMFMTIMIVANPMLQSVIEEKQQRIAEVLLGSAQPFDIMMGKLLGNVGVALTLLVVYGFGGVFWASRYDMLEIMPLHLAGWILAYEVLAVMLYGSVFIAIGAAVSEQREAQSLLTPVVMVMIFPLMVWFEILREPMGGFATWLSLFPPATPMLMPMRLCATSAVPLWQPLLGIAIVLLSTLATVWAAGRVFRIGILAQGKAPKPRELIRWILRG